MTITAPEARALCTKTEYALYRESLVSYIKQHTTTELRTKIRRARDLRDKWRDQAKRQRGEQRGKQLPRGARPAGRHENTKRKAELFDEVVQRFEARLTELEKREASQAEASTKKPAKKAVKKKAAKKAAKKKSARG